MLGSAALVVAAATGAVVAVTVTGGRQAPAAPRPARLSTATVVRTNLATTALTPGVLGYAAARPLINLLPGTYTSLPAEDSTIRPGQVLYRVDDQPVIAMRGRIPGWRDLGPGVPPGPDVRQLQASLIALGYASGLFSAPSGVYDGLTDYAVQRWQAAVGLPVTGSVALGQVVFITGPLRVGALTVFPGSAAVPGQRPYQVTTTRRAVTVPLNPNLPDVTAGSAVTIVLPSQSRTPGRAAAVGPVPASAGSAAHGPYAGATGVLTVKPDRPRATGTGSDVPVQVSLTVQSVRHVLAVPVSALLALSGGGYGLEIVTASGHHYLTGVTVGVFAGGLVQVSGAGVASGTKVVVAQ